MSSSGEPRECCPVSCVSGAPQEMCCDLFSEGEQGCPGVLLSVDAQICRALVEWLVCTVLSLSVEGFPLVLAHLLTLSKGIAVHGQEMGCRGLCPTDPEQSSNLAMPGPQMNFGLSSVPVVGNLGEESGEKRKLNQG